MKKLYLLIISCFFFLGCISQNNVELVNEFIQSYNKKDSIKTFNLLHQDFSELWGNEITIISKKDFRYNYSWGKVMNDMEEIVIIKTEQNFVETISTYYSDRDKLLGIPPYKSKRIYKIKDHKIIKIIGGKFEGYNEYDQARRKQYEVFFEWLSKNYGLKPSDFPFDKKGAEKLISIINKYNKS